MKYYKSFYCLLIIAFTTINVNITSKYIQPKINNFNLSKIAWANPIETGDNTLKKCAQGTTYAFPTHGTTATLYCGDCLAHHIFISGTGSCKLY